MLLVTRKQSRQPMAVGVELPTAAVVRLQNVTNLENPISNISRMGDRSMYQPITPIHTTFTHPQGDCCRRCFIITREDGQ